MFKKNGPRRPDIGTTNDHAIDVPANTAVGGDKTELVAVATVGAKIKASGTQPTYGQRLKLVAGIENSKGATIKALAVIQCGVGVFEYQFSGAGLANPAATEIGAGSLRAIALNKRIVDQHIDACRDVLVLRSGVDRL